MGVVLEAAMAPEKTPVLMAEERVPTWTGRLLGVLGGRGGGGEGRGEEENF